MDLKDIVKLEKFQASANALEIEAVFVDNKLIHSLPRMGGPLQQFGEQVQISNGKKRTFAQLGDYIVKVEDELLVLSSVLFKIFFSPIQEKKREDKGSNKEQKDVSAKDENSEEEIREPSSDVPTDPLLDVDAMFSEEPKVAKKKSFGAKKVSV